MANNPRAEMTEQEIQFYQECTNLQKDLIDSLLNGGFKYSHYGMYFREDCMPVFVYKINSFIDIINFFFEAGKENKRLEFLKNTRIMKNPKLDSVPILFYKIGESFAVRCPSVKVMGTSKKSFDLALEDFKINLSIFFGVHKQDDTLEEALIEFGWTKFRGTTSDPELTGFLKPKKLILSSDFEGQVSQYDLNYHLK